MLPETFITYTVLFISLGLVTGLALIMYLQRRYIDELRVLEARIKLLEKEHGKMKSAVREALELDETEALLRKLREKRRRRYIVFYLLAEKELDIDPEELEEKIINNMKSLFGLTTIADSDLHVVFFDKSHMAGIIRVNYRFKYLALAALSLIRELNGVKAIVVPVASTGTIKRAKRIIARKKKPAI